MHLEMNKSINVGKGYNQFARMDLKNCVSINIEDAKG